MKNFGNVIEMFFKDQDDISSMKLGEKLADCFVEGLRTAQNSDEVANFICRLDVDVQFYTLANLIVKGLSKDMAEDWSMRVLLVLPLYKKAESQKKNLSKVFPKGEIRENALKDFSEKERKTINEVLKDVVGI